MPLVRYHRCPGVTLLSLISLKKHYRLQVFVHKKISGIGELNFVRHCYFHSLPYILSMLHSYRSHDIVEILRVHLSIC